MRRLLPYVIAIAIATAAAVMGCWLYGVNQPEGCPLELLRDWQEENPLSGRPAEVREVEQSFGGRPSVTTTVTSCNPAGDVLCEDIRKPMGSYLFAQRTMYFYSPRGWLAESVRVATHEPVARTSYLYVPGTHRIVIDRTNTIVSTPRASGLLVASGPARPWSWMDRLRYYLHIPSRVTLSTRQDIKVDHRNRYVEMADYDGGHLLRRTTYDYDSAGRVRRKIWHEGAYMTSFVYKRDAWGNVVERKIMDGSGKLDRGTGIVCSAYKYDPAGNWVERRNTVLWPGRTKNKWTLSSITTRAIRYQ